MMPKPLQPGGVPIWISGTVNRRVVRRLARFGSGWIPWGPASDDVIDGIARMRSALTEAGSDPSGLQVVGDLPPVKRADGSLDVGATMEAVPALSAAGVTDFRTRFSLPSDHDDAVAHVQAVVAGISFGRRAG